MISALFSKLWGYLAVAAAAVAAVVGLYLKGKSAGRTEEKAKATEKVLENVEKAGKARRDQRDSGKRERVRKFDRR